jgi:hypothetical protein
MPRWMIGALGASSGILLMLLAFLPMTLFGNAIPPRGLLATIVPVFVVSMTLAAIIAPVWVMSRLQRWSQHQQSAQRNSQLERELARLASDPALARWVPLARRQFRADADTIARWEARYQQLLADPRRHAHAAACLDGRFSSDEDIDYADDRSLTRTCAHLQGVERGLRQQGYLCVPMDRPASIAALARIDDAARLRKAFALNASIHFESNVHERMDDNDRGPHEVEEQSLYWTPCNSLIRFDMGRVFPATADSRPAPAD